MGSRVKICRSNENRISGFLGVRDLKNCKTKEGCLGAWIKNPGRIGTSLIFTSEVHDDQGTASFGGTRNNPDMGVGRIHQVQAMAQRWNMLID